MTELEAIREAAASLPAAVRDYGARAGGRRAAGLLRRACRATPPSGCGTTRSSRAYLERQAAGGLGGRVGRRSTSCEPLDRRVAARAARGARRVEVEIAAADARSSPAAISRRRPPGRCCRRTRSRSRAGWSAARGRSPRSSSRPAARWSGGRRSTSSDPTSPRLSRRRGRAAGLPDDAERADDPGRRAR